MPAIRRAAVNRREPAGERLPEPGQIGRLDFCSPIGAQQIALVKNTEHIAGAIRREIKRACVFQKSYRQSKHFLLKDDSVSILPGFL